jgi:sterol desaturase/sphingolipid hydroxylase (fatty acid hydroxylase superfamily)
MEGLKEILDQLPIALGQSLMNYAIIAIIYVVVWKIFKQRLLNWRIQLKERVNSKQIKSELINSIFTLLVSTLLVVVIYLLKSLGYTKIYTDINEYPRFFAFSGFFIFLLVDDTWFYWMHRLLHHPRIFKYIHKVHHKSIDVNPFTSVSFHWAETLLLTIWIVPASMLFPVYVPAFGILQVWGFVDNIKSHLGYEFFPSWWNKTFGKLMTSSTHHNMHHSKFNGNYGVHFRIWDRLLGTEFKDYEKTFDEIQERKKGNISNPVSGVMTP